MIINRLRKPENCTAEYRRIRIEKNQTMRLSDSSSQKSEKACTGCFMDTRRRLCHRISRNGIYVKSH